MAKDVLPSSFISWAGSFMPSGIGIGTGPANMPAISPSPNAPPRRSEITEAKASFIDSATGAANFAHWSMVPSTQPARVSTSGSPGAGLNSQAVSSHRFASLIARRADSPSTADTLDAEPEVLACCKAIDLASLTLIGPSSTVRCISPIVLSPPALNAAIICWTSDGLGSRLGS